MGDTATTISSSSGSVMAVLHAFGARDLLAGRRDGRRDPAPRRSAASSAEPGRAGGHCRIRGARRPHDRARAAPCPGHAREAARRAGHAIGPIGRRRGSCGPRRTQARRAAPARDMIVHLDASAARGPGAGSGRGGLRADRPGRDLDPEPGRIPRHSRAEARLRWAGRSSEKGRASGTRRVYRAVGLLRRSAAAPPGNATRGDLGAASAERQGHRDVRAGAGQSARAGRQHRAPIPMREDFDLTSSFPPCRVGPALRRDPDCGSNAALARSGAPLARVATREPMGPALRP